MAADVSLSEISLTLLFDEWGKFWGSTYVLAFLPLFILLVIILTFIIVNVYYVYYCQISF